MAARRADNLESLEASGYVGDVGSLSRGHAMVACLGFITIPIITVADTIVWLWL
jgi:hypothetical protein